MPGLSVKQPLQKSSTDGLYALNKTLEEMVPQDLKNLFLTIPGERIQIPDYGVGQIQFLFEPIVDESQLQSEIVSRATEQIDRYMPYIRLDHVEFELGPENSYTVLQMVRVYYTILPLDINDVQELTRNSGGI